MIRTYTKKVVSRGRLVSGIFLLLLVLSGGVGLSFLSDKVLHYLVIPWFVTVIFGYGVLVKYLTVFHSLKEKCIVSADGKVEKYFPDELYTRTKHLNGAKIFPIDTKPTELSCSVFWAEGGQVTKCTTSIEVVPDITNLQAYINTCHCGNQRSKDTVIPEIFAELRDKLSPDKPACQCESCTEVMARSIFFKYGLALQSFTRKVTSADMLIE